MAGRRPGVRGETLPGLRPGRPAPLRSGVLDHTHSSSGHGQEHLHCTTPAEKKKQRSRSKARGETRNHPRPRKARPRFQVSPHTPLPASTRKNPPVAQEQQEAQVKPAVAHAQRGARVKPGDSAGAAKGARHTRQRGARSRESLTKTHYGALPPAGPTPSVPAMGGPSATLPRCGRSGTASRGPQRRASTRAASPRPRHPAAASFAASLSSDTPANRSPASHSQTFTRATPTPAAVIAAQRRSHAAPRGVTPRSQSIMPSVSCPLVGHNEGHV